MQMTSIIVKKLMNKKTANISPKSYINKYIYKSLPLHKKRKKKVSDDDFVVPKINEYNFLLELNYNVSQLKKICKIYNLKVSGNKHEKIHRVYNYLKYSFYSLKIQKVYKGYLMRKYIKYKGFKLKKQGINNPTDFLTFKKTNDISFDQLFCYKDEDNFIYGFDIRSIYNMLLINKLAKNPYNRKDLSIEIIEKVTNMIRLGKLLNRNVIIELDRDIEKLPLDKQLNLSAVAIFQKMDDLGFITDVKWFITLSKTKMIVFVKELIDIWTYRLKIPSNMKRNIIPPHGNPFIELPLHRLRDYSYIKLKKTILRMMRNLVSAGVDKDARYLGTHYVLGALTLVNYSAAIALPWMYDSFRYNNYPIVQ